MRPIVNVLLYVAHDKLRYILSKNNIIVIKNLIYIIF